MNTSWLRKGVVMQEQKCEAVMIIWSKVFVKLHSTSGLMGMISF